ncbi:MAG: ExeM/NucH family extracellular endonuclease [Actinomycetota bacterium]
MRVLTSRLRLAFAAVAVLLGLVFTAPQPLAAQTSDPLLFTQYIEGSSFNKAIEISNLGSSSVDLSTYSVELYSNGNSAPSNTVTLSGTLAPSDSFVIANPSANAAILAETDLQSGSVANWNGDDAVALRNGTDLVDVFGQIGFDPGTQWDASGVSTLNETLCRKAGITEGDPDGSDAFDPSIEWDGLPQDDVTGLGNPTCADPAGADPLLFTQYIEGSSNKKAIEISNLGSSPVDLSTYTIELYSNGNTSANDTQALSGTLPAGASYVVANPSADPVILAETDLQDGIANWNGDDAITLVNGTDLVDVIGQIGDDPGSAWTGGGLSTANQTLCRKAGITEGDPDGSDAFDPSIEWDGFAIDTVTGLGTPGACITSGGPTAKKIHEVQGTGSGVTDPGVPVEVQAVVVGDFQGGDQLRGFFLQEEDADADADPATSEGIFVFCSSCPVDVAVGDLVTVTGPAEEFFDMSQIDAADGGSVTVDGTAALPTPVSVDLPAAGSTTDAATFESIEGMLATFTDTLIVSEYFQLARYGQLVLTADARPSQFTDTSAPDVTGYATFLDDLATRRIILDDDNNIQNSALGSPDTAYFWPRPGLSTTSFLRGGDSISNLTGVLHWSFAGQTGTDAWRIRPVEAPAAGFDYSFTNEKPRPLTPPAVSGDVTVATFNVLNYFETLDIPGNTCGPSALECRGANSTAELDRQRQKIAAAIAQLDADIVGIIEVENDAGAALNDLLNGPGGVNAIAGAGTYAAVATPTLGGDAIKVGFMYKPGTVSTVGSPAVLDSSVDPTFIDTKNRPVLIQTFVEDATEETFTLAVNHLKSKGSDCDDVGDPNLNDGSGNCNGTRTDAAQALANYLATDPTGSGDPDYMIIGDLNAYAMETPITTLESSGYTDLLEAFQGPSVYTYLFDGQEGYLDYALANTSMLAQVTGAAPWNINADEMPLFDYNDGVQDPNEASFQRESTAATIFANDPFRSSDHDPVLVGLTLDDGSITCGGLEVTVDLNEGDTPTSGNDVILGTPGNDRIVARSGDDVICGEGGNDLIFGNAGNDTVIAGDGNDRVFGGSGDDTIDGGAGRDAIYAGRGEDEIEGGDDDDYVSGGADSDIISGGDGADHVAGGRGNDTLSGGAGDDQLRGGADDDDLAGGLGDDDLVGNRGTDTCDGGPEDTADTAARSCETVIDVP